MPCDTISLSRVEFSLEHTDANLLEKALESEGWRKVRENQFRKGRESLVITNGKLILNLLPGRNQDEEVNSIKRAYSVEVVKSTAAKFGWALKESQPGKQFMATRRF